MMISLAPHVVGTERLAYVRNAKRKDMLLKTLKEVVDLEFPLPLRANGLMVQSPAQTVEELVTLVVQIAVLLAYGDIPPDE